MGSSSRKKSTPKKKSSKLSSKVRSMKKSKKTRSRKRGHRHRHDSSSDDDSVSSLSISSPSDSYSDGDSMSPRPKRRSVKKREKHASKTSSSRKDNRDSKKRKKSKRNDDPKPRKKVRRDVKISSASSDSHSCSTFSSDSERSEDETVKKRSRDQKKGKRDRRREKSVSPLSTSRSVSPSSVGYQDEIQAISHHSEETFGVEKKSRRLKSIIVIPEKSIEEDELEKDMHFEEIVNDRDDYPYKSSSGEGGREGSSPSPPGASAYGQHVENDGFTSDNNGMSELTAKGIEVERVNNETKELEAILKQKALENLEKFRGARKTSVKPAADQKDVNSSDHNDSVRTENSDDHNKNKLADSTISDRDIPSVETAETPSLNNQPEEANEDTPKFQEKPISKMSGGEMVQTKYQIYIPKRAPRKFNR